MLLGAHESIAKGLDHAVELARADGCDGFQIFTKSSGQWRDPPLDPLRIDAFRQARGPLPVLAHASYLPNLCAVDATLLEKSRVALVNEVLRCDALGVDQVVFHPGAHLGAGVEAGVARVVESIGWILERTRGTRPLLTIENTAGQGTCIGATFAELGAMVRGVDDPRVAVCIDTCHLFAAGYDLVDDYDAVIGELDREVGLAHVRAMHLNDSKKPRGARVDRHDRPGSGEMGLGPFGRLMNDRRFDHVLGVVEIPPAEVRRGREVRVIRPLLDRLRGLRAASVSPRKRA